MVIKKSLFVTYEEVLEFHVKLTIERFIDQEKGSGFMYLIINTAPRGGTCTLNPPPGRLLQADPDDIDPVTGKVWLFVKFLFS